MPGIESRFLYLYNLDHGMPAFRELYPKEVNPLIFLDDLLKKPELESEVIMTAIEEKHNASVEAKALIAYRDLRAAEYPAISDQIDALVKSTSTGDNSMWMEMVNKCMAVKAKYPKPVIK